MLEKGKLKFRVRSETQDFNVFSNSNVLLNDKYVDDAKAIKSCCMLDIKPPPKPSSFKEIHNEPKKLREPP